MLSLLVAGSMSAQSTTEITFETCVSFDSIVTKKQTCYVFDRQNKTGRWEIILGTGINATAGGLIIGGSASSMIVSKIVFPGTEPSSPEAALKLAEKKLQAEAPRKAEKVVSLYESAVLASISNRTIRTEDFVSRYLTDSQEVKACFSESSAIRNLIP